MAMRDYPKHVKRAFRELARAAYEEDMKRELGQLALSFDAWRAGKIDVWDLHNRVHKYHNGPARELYNQYNDSPEDLSVAYAVVRGILSRDSIPAELEPYLEGSLSFYRSLDQRSPADSPDQASGDETA